MDDFSIASDMTGDFAVQLVESGLHPEQVAEAMIVAGLALWGAEAGRKADAEALLRIVNYEMER